MGLALIAGTIQAQSLQVSSSNSGEATLGSKGSTSGVVITEPGGSELVTGDYNADASDPSFKVYPLSNGGFVVRENIANFLLFDSFGNVKNSVSNSSQSEGGEAISELSMDPAGKTIVAWNPKIVRGGNTGSQGQLIFEKKNPVGVYYSTDRALSTVEVSPNGEFIAFASVKSGTEDQVELMDRFGNTLNTISFDQEVKGVTFSENGLFVTIYSGGRVAAYEVRSGERVGSTSIRNTTVQFAAYDPIDKTIVALTGSGSSTISNIELRAVNVAARKIATEEFSGSLKKTGTFKFERTGSGRYTISGFDKGLDLRATF